MLKRKRKNPENKKTLRHIAEFLADAIENHNKVSYLYAEKISQQLKKEDPIFCENCQDFMTLDRIEYHDPQLCFEDIDIDDYDISYGALEEVAEDLAEDLGIVDYVKVFRYRIQYDKYAENNFQFKFKPSVNLTRVNLSGVNLSGVNFHRANLSEAYLSKSNLSKSNLSEANLSGADLSGAKLSESNLYGTNLSGTNLSGTNFIGSTLDQTDFTNSKITSTTNLTLTRNKNRAINLNIRNPRKTAVNEKKKSNKIKSAKKT